MAASAAAQENPVQVSSVPNTVTYTPVQQVQAAQPVKRDNDGDGDNGADDKPKAAKAEKPAKAKAPAKKKA